MTIQAMPLVQRPHYQHHAAHSRPGHSSAPSHEHSETSGGDPHIDQQNRLRLASLGGHGHFQPPTDTERVRNATRIDPLNDDQKAIEIKQQYRSALDRAQQERSDALDHIREHGTAPRTNEDGSVTEFRKRNNGDVVARTRKDGRIEKVVQFRIGEPDRASVRERGRPSIRQNGDNVSVSGGGQFRLDREGRVNRSREREVFVNGVSTTKTTTDTIGFDGKTTTKTV